MHELFLTCEGNLFHLTPLYFSPASAKNYPKFLTEEHKTNKINKTPDRPNSLT